MKTLIGFSLALIMHADQAYASGPDDCGEDLINYVKNIHAAKEFNDSMLTTKRTSISASAVCVIENPIMSDGLSYSILLQENQYYIDIHNGLTGGISTYGPYDPEAYNKSLNQTGAQSATPG